MASPNNGTTIQSLSSITQTLTGDVDDNMGIVTHTLPSITQSATGSYPLQELLTSTVNASAAPFEFAEETLISNLIPTSSISTISERTLTSTINATGTPTFDVITNLTSTVNASESIQAVVTTLLADNTVRASESIEHSSTTTLISIGKVYSSFEFIREASLESTMLATESIDPGVTYNHLITSTVNASDVISLGQEEILVSNTTANSSFIISVERTELLTSAINAADTITYNSWVYEDLSNTVQVSESFDYAGSVYSECLTSTVRVSDWLWAKDFGAIAWVLNTQSAGLTNYNNFGFTSLAFHSGKMYATSPEGIFELDADKDAGRNVDAVYKSGFLDLGTENKKRISDIFVGCTGNDIECEVETYDKQAYTYGMEYRDIDTPYNNRIKPGRGLSSRWWRFTFRNTDGADFQIHDIAVQVARSNRRL